MFVSVGGGGLCELALFAYQGNGLPTWILGEHYLLTLFKSRFKDVPSFAVMLRQTSPKYLLTYLLF